MLGYPNRWGVLMRSYRQRGFSIIEMAITLAVVAIVLTAGVPSFATWLRNLQIRSAAEAVLNGIQVAKMEAVRRNTTVGITFESSSGWTVGCNVVTSTCPGVIQQRPSENGTQNTGLVATNLNSGAPLVFDGSGRVSSGLTAATSPLLLDVSYSSGTCALAGGALRCLRIVVSRLGQIRMCDPALSTTSPNDARAC